MVNYPYIDLFQRRRRRCSERVKHAFDSVHDVKEPDPALQERFDRDLKVLKNLVVSERLDSKGGEDASYSRYLDNCYRCNAAKLGEAESWLQRSLSLRQQLFGVKAVIAADTQVELALVFRREGRLADAEALDRMAIATYRNEPAAKNLPVALHNLGQVLVEQSKPKEAEPLLLRQHPTTGGIDGL